jgi:NAD(P)-dependent dehydrogenase (short-subunit alcohol dehydrogenase family)
MSQPRSLKILITGCTPGGAGAALAGAFHNAGHKVFASGRDVEKLLPLREKGKGIRIVRLDITDQSSIEEAVKIVAGDGEDEDVGDGDDGKEVGGLDILINNAAAQYTMPLADVSLDAARKMFDLNVWGHLAVTQAFLPLLLKSAATTLHTTSTTSGVGGGGARPFQPTVINHTSVGSLSALPWQGIYNSSKAALAMLTSTLRLELAPLGIRVVELKTGGVKTNIINNNHSDVNNNTNADLLPENSIYSPAREVVEKAMSLDAMRGIGMSVDVWAEQVVGDVLGGRGCPEVIWRGEMAWLVRVASLLPGWVFEGMVKRMTLLDVVERIFGGLREGAR